MFLIFTLVVFLIFVSKNHFFGSIISILMFNACTSGFKNIKMTDMEGNHVRFKSIQKDSMLVVVWLAADCPISQQQVLTLNKIALRYPRVSLIGVFTHWDQPIDLQRFKRDFAPIFPLIRDNKSQLFRNLKPTVTPEVQFIKDDKIIYQGAVDNWYYAPGRHRAEPNEHYLDDAIQSALSHRVVVRPFTMAIGCRIE